MTHILQVELLRVTPVQVLSFIKKMTPRTMWVFTIFEFLVISLHPMKHTVIVSWVEFITGICAILYM